MICIAIGKGRRHDLDLLRVSQTRFASQMLVKADKGYQGIKKLHTNSETPHKKPYRGKLTREQRAENRKLARERIVVEHVNRRFKRPCPSGAFYGQESISCVVRTVSESAVTVRVAGEFGGRDLQFGLRGGFMTYARGLIEQ